MQTLNIDGTTYTLKDNRDLVAFTKLAQTKFRKRVYKQSQREYPTFQTTMSTHEYIDRYQMMNVVKHKLVHWNFKHAYSAVTPQYDITVPLVEVLSCE